ncbi:MAG: NAD(P)-dependent oxidoreductase [Chloroflexota bacterium]|nr:NAD(P)-dependent oxidoreductase [Chloroflexota bacterium]
MKLIVFGASGMIGNRIVNEALAREHQVTAVVRDLAKIAITHPNLTVVKGDAHDADHVAQLVAGHDAVVVSVIDRSDPETPPRAAHAVIAGLKRAGLKRVVIVGGAASLEVAPGVRLLDNPEFPAPYKPEAAAMAEVLAIYRAENDLDWTYISPSMSIEPGERTGKFRLGGDQLLTDAQGNSAISTEDFALALIDEVEHPRHLRQRFTVGY